MYSDATEKLKSLNDIAQDAPEKLFNLQKSSIYIYRFEDVIFGLFPHLAAFRKRGTSSKEVFDQHDPFGKHSMFGKTDFGGGAGAMKGAAQTDMAGGFNAMKNTRKSHEQQSSGSGGMGGVGKSSVGFTLG